jgi:hypothetical protein
VNSLKILFFKIHSYKMWVQSMSSMNLVLFQWIYWILFNETSEFTQNSVKILDDKGHISCNDFCLRKGPKPIRNLWIFWEHFKKLKYGKTKENFRRAMCEPFLFCFFFLFVFFGQQFYLPLVKMALCQHLWSVWTFCFGLQFYLPLVEWHFANICEVKLGIVASFGGENFGGKCLNNKRMD